MKIAVIIPVLNEENNINKVVNAIPAMVSNVIVIDNGSTDQTALKAKETGATVLFEIKRGYGNACLKGIASLPPDTDIVVFLDGDYSDYPEEIPQLVAPIINEGYDLVLGSRTLLRNPGLSVVQKFGNWLACVLIRWFYGYSYTDLGPFRAIKKDKLEALGMRDTNFGWTVEMQIKAVINKLKVMEIPVHYRERFSGKSKVSGNLKGMVKAGFKILKLIFKYQFKKQ